MDVFNYIEDKNKNLHYDAEKRDVVLFPETEKIQGRHAATTSQATGSALVIRWSGPASVVFPEGAVVIGGKLLVFYGTADTVCCVASVRLDEPVDHLLEGR